MKARRMDWVKMPTTWINENKLRLSNGRLQGKVQRTPLP
jgi:hypothetical protein